MDEDEIALVETGVPAGEPDVLSEDEMTGFTRQISEMHKEQKRRSSVVELRRKRVSPYVNWVSVNCMNIQILE